LIEWNPPISKKLTTSLFTNFLGRSAPETVENLKMSEILEVHPGHLDTPHLGFNIFHIFVISPQFLHISLLIFHFFK